MTEAGEEGPDRENGERARERALERRVDLVDEVDRVEHKLQRTRLTAWVWMTATVWFLFAGFYTGNWPPAGFMAAVSAIFAASSWGIRRGRRRKLHDLQQEMEALSDDRSPGEPPPREEPGDGERDPDSSSR